MEVLSSSGDGENASSPLSGEEGSAASVEDSGDQQSPDDSEMRDKDEEPVSSKRGHEASDDDWISPNKTAKSRPWSESPVPTSNTFNIIMSVEDLMGDGDNEKNEPRA